MADFVRYVPQDAEQAALSTGYATPATLIRH
jgi:hypothetical protein